MSLKINFSAACITGTCTEKCISCHKKHIPNEQDVLLLKREGYINREGINMSHNRGCFACEKIHQLNRDEYVEYILSSAGLECIVLKGVEPPNISDPAIIKAIKLEIEKEEILNPKKNDQYNWMDTVRIISQTTLND